MNENTMLVPQMGINTEQATANCEELAKAIREMTAGVLTTVNSFCRWVQVALLAEGVDRNSLNEFMEKAMDSLAAEILGE